MGDRASDKEIHTVISTSSKAFYTASFFSHLEAYRQSLAYLEKVRTKSVLVKLNSKSYSNFLNLLCER